MSIFPWLDDKELLREILKVLIEIRGILKPRAVSATLHLNQENKNMPLSIALNGQFSAAPPAFLEFDQPNGQGNQVAPIGPLAYASSNPAVATVDPASGQGVGVAVGTSQITVTDQGNNLTATDTLTVTDTAVSATLNLAAVTAAAAKKA